MGRSTWGGMRTGRPRPDDERWDEAAGGGWCVAAAGGGFLLLGERMMAASPWRMVLAVTARGLRALRGSPRVVGWLWALNPCFVTSTTPGDIRSTIWPEDRVILPPFSILS